MLTKAVEALCEELGTTDDNELETAEHKAEILKEFAEQVCIQVLRRAGIAGSELGTWNRLVTIDGDPPFEDAVPDDDNYLGCIWLHDVPSALNQRHDVADFPQELVCVTGGVQLWIRPKPRPGDKKLHKVMSYEEAARFLIFWLAERILQIIRKNKWDRVQQLPDLFDRLAAFVTNGRPPVEKKGKALLHLRSAIDFTVQAELPGQRRPVFFNGEARREIDAAIRLIEEW